MALATFNSELVAPAAENLYVEMDALGNEAPAGVPFRSTTYTFTRPANTTQYSAGGLVANSVTAASVVPMSWVVGKGVARPTSVRRIGLYLSGTVVTSATFQVYLFSAAPAVATTGDGGAFATDVSAGGTFIGRSGVITCAGFADSIGSVAIPEAGTEITVVPTAATIYGLVVATGTYTPTSAETVSCWLEGWQY